MTSLSNRTHPMLKTFVEGGSDFYMPVAEAQRYDQRPFRSMLIREYIVYRAGRGFHLTKKGRAAWEEFERTEIWRKDPTRPLTAYFDPTVYGLRVVERRKAAVA